MVPPDSNPPDSDQPSLSITISISVHQRTQRPTNAIKNCHVKCFQKPWREQGYMGICLVYVSLFLPTKLKYLRVDLHVSQLYATQNMIVRWSDQKPKPNWNRTKKTTRLNPIIKLVCMSLSSSSLLVVLFACMWCINLEKTNAHPLRPTNPISE